MLMVMMMRQESARQRHFHGLQMTHTRAIKLKHLHFSRIHNTTAFVSLAIPGSVLHFSLIASDR